MIKVNLTTFEIDADTQQWVKRPVAEVIADGDEVTISGPHADWVDPKISIVDPETREPVTRADDAERWARLLPFAYREGDIALDVEEVEAAAPSGAAFRYSADA